MLEVRQVVADNLERNWNSAGYTAPNREHYPFLWLWDSCFHALIWAELGEVQDRALVELENIFHAQDAPGFVPHVSYFAEPNPPGSTWAKRWGRTQSSSISQPPMFGHTIAELMRRGIDVPGELIQKAVKGLDFFFAERKRDGDSGLIFLCHPWESGIDDSPRWDDFCWFDTETDGSDGTELDKHKRKVFEKKMWDQKKFELLESIEFSDSGSPIYNPNFPVLSIGFNALVAFNALELAGAVGDDGLKNRALEIGEALEARFSPELMTWTDVQYSAWTSGEVRTLDSLLVGLLSDAISEEHLSIILKQLFEPTAYGGKFGPPSVHRGEVSFDSSTYWRGTVWPPMAYLFWLMVQRSDKTGQLASDLATAFLNGALMSNFSEYWNADTGKGIGAQPQSWAGLALLMNSKLSVKKATGGLDNKRE